MMNICEEEVPTECQLLYDESLHSQHLVTEARLGSSAAFADLRDIYARRIYHKLLIMTNNRQDAEDALQDTFLRAYLALHTFEGRSSFHTWVTSIAINSALMILRKRRRRSEVSFDVPTENEDARTAFELPYMGPSPEHICDQRQRYACILRSIVKLQPRLRQVVEMRMMGECSIKEMAGTLNISEAAVKSRLCRARARLASITAVRDSARAGHSHNSAGALAPGTMRSSQITLQGRLIGPAWSV
jgi:RNA polymerase sigma-70 factor, ECF subfamily